MKILKTAFCMASLIAISASAVAADPTRNELVFDMPAQSLSAALNSFGRQTGLSVAFYDYTVADRTARALSGKFTPEEALQKLLEDSGLQYTYVNENTVAIRAVEGGDKGKRLSGAAEFYLPFAQLAQADSSLAGTEAIKGNEESQSDVAGQPRLEEIIVTARKTKERLQDLPMSVTALSSEQLEASGAVDLKDVLRSIPGLSFGGNERGLSSYTIRAIANMSGTEPTVGIYLDDISLITSPSNAAGAFDAILFDIERLEVLKGPQGTLYGGSAMGGAIKYVSARPDPSAFSSSVATGVGTTAHGSESYTAEGVVNIPLIADVLAVRAGFYYLHEGGYVDNVANANIENTAYSSTPFPTYTPLTKPSLSLVSQDDYNDADTYVGRVSLLWQPDPTWSIRPAFFYQNTESDNPPYFFTNLDGLTSSYRSIDQPTTDHAIISSLDIVKSWSAVELTSLTAYFDRDFTFDRDYSLFIGGLVPGLYSFDGFAHYQRQTKTFSQELRIASSPDSAARLRWTAGLYYSNQDEEIPQLATFINNTAVGYTQDISRTLDQRAAFGEASYRLTDRLEFTAGLRWFEIETEQDTTVDGPFALGFHHYFLANKEDGVNPKIGLSYQVNDDHLLYTSAAKGFRPGGAADTANLITLCAQDLARLGLTSLPDEYESDNLWSYELGSKNTLAEGRVVLNGALFYSDWKDVQQGVRLATCGSGFVANAGAARVQGAELEMKFNVTTALQLGGNATFTDAEITEVGDFTDSFFKKGDELLGTPEWMASGYGSYTIPVGASWSLQLQADYQYRSKQRMGFDSTQTVRFPVNGAYPDDGPRGAIPTGGIFQEGYDVVNAFASLTNGPTTLRLYVHNALDAQPLISPLFSVQVSNATTVRPRTIGLQLRHNF